MIFNFENKSVFEATFLFLRYFILTTHLYDDEEKDDAILFLKELFSKLFSLEIKKFKILSNLKKVKEFYEVI